MAVVSIINLSELERARRMDAEYYQPEYLRLEKETAGTNLAVDKMLAVSHFVKKGIFDLSPEFYREQGIPFVRVQNIKAGVLSEGELEFIPLEINEKEKKTELEAHDLVLSKVGTIGELSMIPSKYSKANFSQNVIGIKVDKDKILPGYLLIFLLSRYGQYQVKRAQMPQVQSKLELEDIRRLKVIRLQDLEEEIHERVLEAEKLYEQSNLLYSQADGLLLEELRLKDFKPKYELSYSANLSKAFGAHRVDAEYFQPAYEALLKKIEVFEFSKLGQIAERVLAKVKPDPAKIYKYIEISDIAVAIGETNYTERLGKELPPNARIPINGGELIISKVRPTRGAISIIPKELDTSVICSSAFSVFRTESPLKEYLYMVSRSVVGRLQMERPTTGTSYPTIDDRDIENMEIPLLPPQTQQKIASLVRESHEARRKAKELLEEAKSQAEQAIETVSGYF